MPYHDRHLLPAVVGARRPKREHVEFYATENRRPSPDFGRAGAAGPTS
jgi:hypothetical protein